MCREAPAELEPNRNALLFDHLLSGVRFFSFAIAFYYLSAPPLMGYYLRQNGRFPDAFAPISRLIESNYNAPYLWYCNRVWGLEILLIGDEPSVTWGDAVVYALIGVLLVAAIFGPILRRMRSRTRLA